MKRELHGTPVVPGVGWGRVIRPAPRPGPPVGNVPCGDPASEKERFYRARETVISRLQARADAASGLAADVLTATAAMAGDPQLADATVSAIDGGNSAPEAMWVSAQSFIKKFQAAGGMLAERTSDLCDIRDRVVAELLGLPEPGIPIPAEPSVLFADDLAPADTALLRRDQIEAIAIELGGTTSHTAIIARQLGIPCLVAVTDLATIPSGTDVLVDGEAGKIIIEPDPDDARERHAAAVARAEEAARWRGTGQTLDGHTFNLLANVYDGESAKAAADGVAVGIGLFRTEFAFLNSPSEPTIEQQAAEYKGVIDAFPERHVVVRTLDAGSDKPLPFLHHRREENPALGVRGLRIADADAGILERQLQAIALAAGERATRVMAPMVSTAVEAREFAERARAHGLEPGVMIEVPAAALRAREIFREVDFVSLGTNDLVQYTMAADRLSPALAHLCDPWQPAVLELVRIVTDAAKEAGKPVGICGEAAADPLLAAVFVGFGVTSLSAAASALPGVGAALGKVSLDACKEAAFAALEQEDAHSARLAARGVIYP